jgi:hypothetical protein
MTGSTENLGFPYPLTSDFADVQDAFRLATDVDQEIRAQQAPMRSFLARPSFIGRQTANGSGFLSGTQSVTVGAIDWDNTGGLTVGSSLWRQPLAQAPSWWMFGGMVLTTPTGGVVVGEGEMAQLLITTVDQVTAVSTSTSFYQRNDESGTNGEWINIFGMAPVYRGTVSLRLRLNGTTTKATQTGSRFWGFYLGPVT